MTLFTTGAKVVGMAGPKRLSQYKAAERLTYDALAERLRCTRSMAYMLCAGSRRPSLDMALRIELVTSTWGCGAIRCHEWTGATS